MKRSWKWTAFAGSVLALGSAFVAGRSWADGIPATGALAYSGRLEAPNGDPLAGDYNLEVKFWNSESGGSSPLCTSNSQPVTLEQGRFTLTLPDECTDAVHANADVWVEVLVDGSSLGRVKTGAVPYAVTASHATTADMAGSADTLGTLGPADLQARVSGACSGANQSIKVINANGTVSCETDDNTTYTGGSGVTVSGTTISADTSVVQARVGTGCPGTNQSIKVINANGTVSCETDDNTTYTGGSGVTVSGSTIVADTNYVQRRVTGTCPENQAIRAISVTGSVTCETTAIRQRTTFSRTTPGAQTVSGQRFCALAGVGINTDCSVVESPAGSGTWVLTYGSGGGTCRWNCIPE